MTIPNATFDRATLIGFAGLVGADAFGRLDDDHRIALWMRMHELPYLSDEGLLDATLNAVRSNQTWDSPARPDFCCAEMAVCHREARRRHVAAGHDEACHAATIYTEARKLLGLLRPELDLGLCNERCGRNTT